jgi:hypothetical protein
MSGSNISRLSSAIFIVLLMPCLAQVVAMPKPPPNGARRRAEPKRSVSAAPVAQGKTPVFGRGPEQIQFKRFDPKAAARLPAVGRFGSGSYLKTVTKNGKPFIRYAALGGSEKRFGGGEAYYAGYPDLAQRDIVRMLDGLYRFESLTNGVATFERLKPSQFPSGTSVGKGSYGFPIGGSGQFGVLHRPWSPPGFKLEQPATAKEGRPEVTVSVGAGDLLTRGERWKQVVHKGDIVWLGRYGHRVLNIVLSDPKRGVVGWVDLDPKVAGLRGPPSFRLHKPPGRPVPVHPLGPLGFTGDWSGYFKNGKTFVSLRAKSNAPGLFDHSATDKFQVFCGKFAVGEAVRMLDGVYRLADGSGLLKRVSDKELSAGARPAPHSYGIPFEQPGDDFALAAWIRLHQSPKNLAFVYDVHIIAYRKFAMLIRSEVFNKYLDKQYRGKMAVTEVLALVRTGETREKLGVRTRLHWTYSSQWIKEGDLLWIGPYAHRVKKIVLSDAKRKIAGWVDIDQDVARTKKKSE